MVVLSFAQHAFRGFEGFNMKSVGVTNANQFPATLCIHTTNIREAAKKSSFLSGPAVTLRKKELFI